MYNVSFMYVMINWINVTLVLEQTYRVEFINTWGVGGGGGGLHENVIKLILKSDISRPLCYTSDISVHVDPSTIVSLQYLT